MNTIDVLPIKETQEKGRKKEKNNTKEINCVGMICACTTTKKQ